jgi:hypothetical protein
MNDAELREAIAFRSHRVTWNGAHRNFRSTGIVVPHSETCRMIAFESRLGTHRIGEQKDNLRARQDTFGVSAQMKSRRSLIPRQRLQSYLGKSGTPNTTCGTIPKTFLCLQAGTRVSQALSNRALDRLRSGK